jgi:multiple sugar transport system substrate-binding protein
MKLNHSKRGTAWRAVAVVATGVVLSAVLGACSSTSGSASTGTTSASALTAALNHKSSITVWTWGPPVKNVATAFEKLHPKITVNVVNAGTGNVEYTKLQNAIKAGSGAPDIAQIEYYALPQFALSKSLQDLSAYGFQNLKSDFASGPWSDVNSSGALYALPQDSGPMVLYYNEKEFEQYGLTVPTTWAQYAADAKKLHAADPKKYITNDTGDAGFTTSMIWQAGGTPYVTKGTDVTINLADAGATKFASMWSPLVTSGDIAPITSWSDEWYKGLSDGTIATLITGAWMPADLESGVASASGDWRVAPMPTYDGTAASAENGGSSDAILQQSKNKLVAADFLKYMNENSDGTKIQIKAGSFPSTTRDLNSAAFLDEKVPYFGNQQINKVLVQASKDVVPGWSYLPFQVYANSIYNDSVGQFYAGKTTLAKGLAGWQAASATYGNEQGFKVTSK